MPTSDWNPSRSAVAEPTINEVKKRFENDRFATENGAVIEEIQDGYARCSMALEARHKNAAGSVMGGAIFTLADFAFAVAANSCAERISVSLQHDITYLAPARGKTVIAEARCVKAGRTACLYTVDVTDDVGTHVAYMTVNGFLTGRKIE